MTTAGTLADVRRIVVLRASAVGDFVIALPALEALKAAYPEASLTVIGRPWLARFLAGRPGPVDDVMPLPPWPGLTSASDASIDRTTMDAFLRDARARRFDLALQMHGGGRHANPLVSSLGARCTAGFRAADAPPLDRTLPHKWLHHEGLRLLELAAVVGAPPVVVDPRLALTPDDQCEADEALDHPASRDDVVVVQPGATDSRRCWPPERFAAVADALADAGARIVVNGTADEAARVEAVIAGMRHRAGRLPASLSLGGLAAVIARARLLVTNDTGPWHLARAVGTPAVAIVWISNVVTHGLVAAEGQRMAVSWRMDCPVCGRNCIRDHCDHRASFVDDVAVEEVLALAGELYTPRDRARAASSDAYAASSTVATSTPAGS